jgi:hypothetical protein
MYLNDPLVTPQLETIRPEDHAAKDVGTHLKTVPGHPLKRIFLA